MTDILSDDDIKRHREAAQRDPRGRSFIGATVLALIERLEAAERERDAMAALLTEARGAVAYANYHGSSGAPDALLARIDALAAKEQSK